MIAIWTLLLANTEPALAADQVQVEFVDAKGKIAKRIVGSAEQFHLANKHCDYTFTPTGLLSISNRKSGITLSVSDIPYAPLSVTIVQNGKEKNVEFENISARFKLIGSPNPSAVQYTFEEPEVIQLSLRIDLVAARPELTRWCITMLKTGENVSISKIRLPSLRNVMIGNSQADDWFVAPAYAYHGAGMWLNTLKDIPAQMGTAINWASIYDNSGKAGLGYFLDDKNDLDVILATSKDASGLRSGFEFTALPEQMPEAYVAVYEGDWHRTADYFRTIAGKRIPEPKNPAWVRDLDAWQSAAINEIGGAFNVLPKHFQATVQPRGARLLNIYSASCDGAWVYCGCYPYPNPYYGTEEELRDAVMRVRDMGGRSIFYINYQLSIPYGPSVKKIGPVPVSLIPNDIPKPFMPAEMQPVTDRTTVGYASDEFVVDRRLREWSDRNRYWALHYAKNFKVDGIYWDQLACFSTGTKESAWNIARITNECRETVPDFISCGEGVGAAYGKSTSLGLASAVFHHTELYRYTFPSHIVIDGAANGATTWGDVRYSNERYNAVFLDGCRFDNLPPDGAFSSRTIALRQKTKQLLYQAAFGDTQGISLKFPDGYKKATPSEGCVLTPVDGVQAKRFVLNTPSSRLVLVNTINNNPDPKTGTKKDGKYTEAPDYANDQSLYQKGVIATVDITGIGPVKKAWAFLWGGEIVPVAFKKVSATAVSFEVPAAMQATVVLVNRCEPLISLEAPVMAAAGSNIPVKVEILNLDNAPVSGSIGWRLPSGWKSKGAKYGSIKSGAKAVLQSNIVPSAKAVREQYSLHCTASTNDKRTAERYMPLSIVPSPYVQWDYDKEGNLIVTLQELKGSAANAEVELMIRSDSGARVIDPVRTVSIPGKGTASIEYQLEERGKMSEACVMRLGVTADGIKQTVPVRLTPYLMNGSFERTAGDGMPDLWESTDFSGKVDMGEQMSLVSLDESTAFDGRYSLRINPYKGAVKDFRGITVFPQSYKLLYNRKYRVSGYMRIPEGGKGIIFAGQEWQPMAPAGPPVNGWQKFERVFTTDHPEWGFVLVLNNNGNTPVWFDAINIEELEQ